MRWSGQEINGEQTDALPGLARLNNLVRSVRNLPGIIVRQTHYLTPRDVMNANRVVTTQSAFQRLQETLAS